jgi:hypothetical protein
MYNISYFQSNNVCGQSFTESSAAFRVLVLHHDAVNDLAELFEVRLKGFVGGLVVEAADEELAQHFALRPGGSLLALRGGLLDLDVGAVDGVRAGCEAGIGLFWCCEGDEAKAAEINLYYKMRHF